MKRFLHWLKWTWPVRHLRWKLAPRSKACSWCGQNRVYRPRRVCSACEFNELQRRRREVTP